MRQKPILSYCGLTVILSRPSRFDTARLLTGKGGVLFSEDCLQPDYNIMQCDIRLASDQSPFIDGTKCILLLGEEAMHSWIPDSRGNTLNELRGSPLSYNGIPAIASYFPQDASDIKDYEGQVNGKETVEEKDEEGDEKVFAKTARRNYAFWLQRDVWKCKQIINNGGKVPYETVKPVYHINPEPSAVIDILTKTKGKNMFFDIETDYEEQNLLCFAFSFDSVNVYCIPVLDSNYRISSGRTIHIIRALAIAINNNTIVAHNGATFDFLVLAMKYGIPVNKCYDTMDAMRRCFPDVEKSLGHCTSYWTWERFHKDTDSRSYFTYHHMMQKLQYCGKDVYTMGLIHREMTKYSKTIPGLERSIQVSMDSIRPYLTMTMQGIRYSLKKVDEVKAENDALMNQYVRIINMLVGDYGLTESRKSLKGKGGLFPGSNKQICHYFHTLLQYEVVGRSKTTDEPSLGKKAMFTLALQYPDNPVITFILLYRAVQKEYGSLKFVPWKDDNNQLIRKGTYDTE